MKKMVRDLRTLYEPKKDYYEPQKVKGAFDESNGDSDKKLSIEGILI